MSSSAFFVIWLSVQIIGVPIAFCFGRKLAKRTREKELENSKSKKTI